MTGVRTLEENFLSRVWRLSRLTLLSKKQRHRHAHVRHAGLSPSGRNKAECAQRTGNLDENQANNNEEAHTLYLTLTLETGIRRHLKVG